MSVPNQVPIVTYTANGTTASFPITFDLHDERYLVVTVNKERPPVGGYAVNIEDGAVVFRTPPNNGDEVTLARDTVPDRQTNFESYNNSMRPEAFNHDFDKVWHFLQEQNLVDAISLARLKDEIEWRRTHDFNYDMLAQLREKQIFDGLKQYVDTFIAATNPNIFGGVTAGVVFALDHKSVQTHLEEIADQLEQSRQELGDRPSFTDLSNSLKDKATFKYVDDQVGAIENGFVASFKTYEQADTAKSSLPTNSSIQVTNDPDEKKNGLYNWDGVVLTKSSFDPLQQSKDYTNMLNNKNGIVPDIKSSEVEFAVTDELGNTPLYVDKNANTVAKNIRSESVESKTTNTAGIEILEIETSDFEVAYTDDNGVVVFGIKKDGSIFPELSTKPTYLARNIKLQMSDWIHSFLYGQSLANGVGTGSVVSASQPYKNICMKSGVYPRPQDTEYYDSSNVKPLVEERSISGSSQIETPTSGFLNKLSANFESVNKNYVFFGNAGGQSGARIEQISKGSSYYDSQLQLIRDAMKLTQERNLSYSVHFIAWKQGEASQSNKTVKEYYDLFLKFKDDISADIKSITGQDFEPILLTYQVASQLWSKNTQIPIARAQWLASRDRGDIMMSHSMYAMSYAPDYLHLSAGASEQCGRWFGNAAFHVYQEQEKGLYGKFKPVQPDQVLWQGKIIDITFDVNVGDLTLDTSLVSETHNYGFDIWNDKDELILDAIKSITVLADNRVRIVLHRAFVNHKLSYGRGRSTDPQHSGSQTGARGNLRDQAGDADNYTLPNTSTKRYMHNWCVLFEYSQQFGFYEGMK